MKALFVLVLVLLLLSSVSLLTNHLGFAEKLANFAFYTLIVASVAYVKVVLSNDKKND